MEGYHVPDQVLHNIFLRLPGRSLVRFRCVSKQWDSLISDPYLAKSISGRKILLQFNHLYTIDHDNVPVPDVTESTVRISSDFGDIENIKDATIVGTFNGIVLLVLKDTSLGTHMILHNLFTLEYNKVPNLPFNPPPLPLQYDRFIIGFGATPDDFKIIRFFMVVETDYGPKSYSCYVFSVKENSWSKPTYFKQDCLIWNNVGMFLNGFLYWQAHDQRSFILALDIKKMTLSKINKPGRCGFGRDTYGGGRSPVWYFNVCLGELHGCLCMIHIRHGGIFDLWVMKDQDVGSSWSIAHSFTLSFEGNYQDKLDSRKAMFFPIRVLDNGRILLTNIFGQVIIYDTSNDSDKRFNAFEAPDSTMSGIEYLQSLVSPSNMCSV